MFLLLLKLGIGIDVNLDKDFLAFQSLTLEQWQEIMHIAENQGVLAIVFDGLHEMIVERNKNQLAVANYNPNEWQNLILECAGSINQVEHQNQYQKYVASNLAAILANENISMMVFKGQANAIFYPKSNHRAVGDIDCWLFGEAEKGDVVIKKYGAEVDYNWYRHSKIFYQDETIENHRVMSHTRGSKKHKEMERELEAMLNPMELSSIEGCGKALMPSAQFNACFLIYHALHHFISEGLRVKQILDWAMFL